MERRKIQLIAGTTYSISLPKQWVRKNSLKEQDEISIHEKNDRSLLITPQTADKKKLQDISVCVDDYIGSIDQVLFAVYYLGIETITIYSRSQIQKEMKTSIRKTLTHMSGTEISYEDKKKIIITVLLDRSKVDISNLLYRVSLIIELSITNLTESLDIQDISINENEIDRLYHLMSKIISLSLIDSNVLLSSNIRNVSLIPSYFLIAKKLENIADNINHLAHHLHANNMKVTKKRELLEFAKTEINRSIKHLMQEHTRHFSKTPSSTIRSIQAKVATLEDDIAIDYLRDIIRYIDDIQGEIVQVTFYKSLIHEGFL